MSATVQCGSVLLLSMVAAGCQAPRPTKTSHDDELTADTLVTPESQLLGKPADMVAMADGSSLILDYSGPSILVLDSTGTRALRELGRPGSGPGELRTPIGLAVRGDTVITANVGNGRFESYLRSGEPLPSRPAPTAALSGRLALNPDGGFILPTNGADSTLARLYGPNGLPSFGVGVPLVPYDPVYRLGPYRAAALRGDVPDYYRNGVLAALGPDSVVWLAFNTEPAIERFGPGGRPLGRTRIADPALAGIRQRYIARNREDSTGRRVYPLLYIADLKPETGRLWLLLNTPPGEAAVVLRLGATGEVERRFRAPNVSDVWRLALRPAARELLLVSAETAAVFRVRLTADQWDRAGSAP